ncbi:hypothetical protein BB8028_0006g00720 [Beauveria bassiana]|uniref:Uncharacterized protein n=2 Tax=Beauveria bassiana TaxID=176275 RepID=A0A2S7YHT2_BEABA|nr:hypothetical protein BB8028_0006g00720 [Beauveria bassiana]
MAEPDQPSLRSIDLPFLGICSRCKRIAWCKNSTAFSDKWPHDCDVFASPHTHARIWDTVESIDGSRFNLFYLLQETNDYLQAKFGGSPHLVRELPEPPRLYWPYEIPAELKAYINWSSEWTSHQTTLLAGTTLVQGTPFISFCPACCRVVWFSSRGDLRYHWPPLTHFGLKFAAHLFEFESPDVNKETESSLERWNIWYQTLFNLDVSRLRHFHDPPPVCHSRFMPLRVPCDQFTDLAPEIWVRRDEDKSDHSVEWQQRATEQHVRLRSKFGASRHPIEDGADSRKLSGQPIFQPHEALWEHSCFKWPLIEDPDIMEIMDFRDRIQKFFRHIMALLEGEQTPPILAPHPPRRSTDDLQITALPATAEMGTAETDAAEASMGTNVLV